MIGSLPPVNAARSMQPQNEINIPDVIENFALGVARVNKQHVVVAINSGDRGFIQKLKRTGARVVAVDPRRHLQNVSHQHPGLIRRIIGGIPSPLFAFPLEARGADIVFVDLVLHCIPAPGPALKEIRRILKPGGRLVLTDIQKRDPIQAAALGQEAWRGVYPGDVRHWLKGAGFSNIIVNPVPSRYLCPGEKCTVSTKPTGYLMATATA